MAGALKLYLRELPVPLIPYQLYSRFINAASKLRASWFCMLLFCMCCVRNDVGKTLLPGEWLYVAHMNSAWVTYEHVRTYALCALFV